MKNLWTSVASALLALALLWPAGCKSGGHATDGAPTAACPVCAHEGDLACVCVDVGPDTPSCRCGGQVYYFCSTECRADFEAHPERYLPR